MELPLTFLEHLQYWFASVASAEIVVCDDPRFEAQSNMWGISLSEEMASHLSVQVLEGCVTNYISEKRHEAKRRQLVPLLFYLWFDQMSGGLCFSLISITDPAHLDFQCDINPDADLSEILGQVLSSKYLDGIPFEELAVEDSTHSLLEHIEPRMLDIYVARI